ncbi:hypothetical protein [Ruminiclostridium cellobioparum]|uniref:hypothetical protein n=1 Tax=Ruminiclostridium cellobioparum TaxID=29355 RepID=UPI0028AF9528|nr:hypothetical protein [Ruminiclostridium cellobioparum]
MSKGVKTKEYSVTSNFVGVFSKDEQKRRQFAIDLIYSRMANQIKKESKSQSISASKLKINAMREG